MRLMISLLQLSAVDDIVQYSTDLYRGESSLDGINRYFIQHLTSYILGWNDLHCASIHL